MKDNDDRPIDGLWRRIDASGLRPSWRDAPSAKGLRVYGGDGVARIEGHVLRVRVYRHRPFLVVFACLFIPAYAALAWLMISEPAERLWFGVGGPIVGTLTFAVIYALLRYHERLGDYLVIDRAARMIGLPRLKKDFSFADVVAFQWISGRSKESVESEVDLNLLVSESGDVVRYHIMGGPTRRLVRQVVSFSGIPIDEIKLGWRGYRDADKSTVGT